MPTLAKIQPEEFYKSFIRLFDERLSNQTGGDVDEKYRSPETWTQFMLEDFCPQVIKDVNKVKGYPDGRLECRHEKFMRVDLCAFDNVSEPWEGTDVNQTRYGLPLYVHLVIEHENASYPNEEFWKLLHLYAPLKVLICYLPPKQVNYWLDWFNQMRVKACAFHPRSADDAYLAIIGQRGAEKPSQLNWQGYSAEKEQHGFAQIN